MATAKKQPSGNWRIRIYVGDDEHGKHKYKSFTASTKKEAEFMAAQYNLKRKEKPKGITVGEAIDGYIASKENVLSPTTIICYKSIRKNQLQSLMNVQLDKLTQIMVQSAINKESARLSPKSVRNAHGLLTAAITMYMPDFVFRTTLPAKQHIIKDLPRPEQIIESIKGTKVELPAMLALWFGLRMSEVRGIRYKDISNGVLTIQNVRIAGIEKKQTKTYNSTRQLEIPDRISRMIGTGEPDEYIVKMSASKVYEYFVNAVMEHTGKKMTFHDLRHVNASIMLMLGVPDKYAMERGGWSTPYTMKSVYQHTFSEERKAVDIKIDSYMNSLFTD